MSHLIASAAAVGASFLPATAAVVPAGALAAEPEMVGEHYNIGIPCPDHSSTCCPYRPLAADIVAALAAVAAGAGAGERFEADVGQIAAAPLRLEVADPDHIASHIVVDCQAPLAAVLVVVLRYSRTLGSTK